MRRLLWLPLALLACESSPLTSATDVPRARDDAAPDAAVMPDVATSPDVPTSPDVASAPDDVTLPDVTTVPADAPPSAGPDYATQGPLATRQVQGTLTAPTSTGCTGSLCTVNITVTLPASDAPGRAAPWPLAVFSSGFSTASTAYAVTTARLASWGYAVIRYDLQGENFLNAATHSALANIHVALVDWARAQGESGALRGLVDATRVVAAGHSRGGKVAALAATRDPRVVAVVGLDPVDSPPPFQQPSADYPLASAALRGLTRDVPLVAIGAEFGGRSALGMPCAPTQYNYATFFDGARGPGLEVVLRNAGHGQFVDDDTAAAASAALCPTGGASNETVRDVDRTLLVAWAERFVRGADVGAWTQGAWLQARVADRTFASVRRR